MRQCKEGSVTKIVSLFLKATRSLESNISIDTRHIVQQICVSKRSFVFILLSFIHEFLKYTFKITVGRGKRKRKKKELLLY